MKNNKRIKKREKGRRKTILISISILLAFFGILLFTSGSILLVSNQDPSNTTISNIDNSAEDLTLVCIHGYWCDSLDFDDIRADPSFIAYYGSENMVCVDYYDDNTDAPEFDGVYDDTHIIDVADKVCDYLIRLKSEGVLNSHLDIVAHSMGGLVTRSLIKWHYPELKANGMTIDHVGMLATPNHGSIGAYYWGMNAQCEDMDPGFSTLLPVLNDETYGGITPYSVSDTHLTYSDIQYSTYWGWLDIIVGEHDDVYIDDVDCVNFDYALEDHLTILYSEEVLTDLLAQLQIPRPGETDPPSITNIQVSDDPLEIGNMQTINANSIDYSGVLSATAYIEFPVETIIATIGMVDDGTNGDASSGDNIYTCQWDSTAAAEGYYRVDINAIDDSLANNEQDINNGATFTLQTSPPPDTDPPSITNIQVSDDPLEIGNMQTITANIIDSSGVLSATAYIEFPDETIIATIGMVDDGTNGDASSGDNIYTCQWDSTAAAEGYYRVDINATDDSLANNEQDINNGATFTLSEINLPEANDVKIIDLNGGNVTFNDLLKIEIVATDDTGITNVSIDIENPDETVLLTILLYDDETHGDTTSGDGNYTNTWNVSSLSKKGTYFFDVRIVDSSANLNVRNVDNVYNFTIQAEDDEDEDDEGDNGKTPPEPPNSPLGLFILAFMGIGVAGILLLRKRNGR